MIEPDTKDWTWVLERPCPDCGFDASSLDRDELPHQIRVNAGVWVALCADSRVAERPVPEVWSPLEYACHVRDVNRISYDRVGRMLTEDDPTFDDWDQDTTALDDDYAAQEPEIVGAQVAAAAYYAADRYAAVPDGAWGRPGRRSNGSEFTVDSLARYHLHDLLHHAHDVAPMAGAATVAAYDAHAAAYAEGAAAMPPALSAAVATLATRLGKGARVLEIGSGPGRDALALEAAGLSVRRTDITPGFVRLLRAEGLEADLVDPLTDDLDDPARPGTPYDAVWASACLLHVARADLSRVLTRLAGATRPGGLLLATLKEGDGEAWSTHGHVASPRHFVYWREPALTAAVGSSGWVVDDVGRTDGLGGDRWLLVTARRG